MPIHPSAYKRAIEKITPPFFIAGMMRRMQEAGFQQTPGIVYTFNTAARDAIVENALLATEPLKRGTAELCAELERDLRPDDPRDMLMLSLSFMVTLSENGLYLPLTNPLPQLAWQEMRDLATLGKWRIATVWIQDNSLRLIQRARLAGYYPGR